MGGHPFVVVRTGLWALFGWAFAGRPVVLDPTWARIRALPLLAKPVAWLAFIGFWSSLTFGGGGSS